MPIRRYKYYGSGYGWKCTYQLWRRPISFSYLLYTDIRLLLCCSRIVLTYYFGYARVTVEMISLCFYYFEVEYRQCGFEKFLNTLECFLIFFLEFLEELCNVFLNKFFSVFITFFFFFFIDKSLFYVGHRLLFGPWIFVLVTYPSKCSYKLIWINNILHYSLLLSAWNNFRLSDLYRGQQFISILLYDHVCWTP